MVITYLYRSVTESGLAFIVSVSMDDNVRTE